MDVCFSCSSFILLCWGTILASIGGCFFGFYGKILQFLCGG